MSTFPEFQDGDFSQVLETEGRGVQYPFLNDQLPDALARIHSRIYDVDRVAYTPTVSARTSATNLLLRSTTPNHASWTASEVTATNNTHANPENGLTDAGRILETTANAAHKLEQAVALSGPGVLSVCVKGIGRTGVTLRLARSLTFAGGYFDLSAGTAITTLSLGDTPTVGIQSLGDGWFRCWLASDAGDATTVAQILIGGGLNYAGDITKGLALYGPQVELGATPGPIILTTSTARTVSAPTLDADDPFAYLVGETAPQDIGLGLWRTTRTFARLPKDQISYGKRSFSRPILAGLALSGYYAVSYDDGVTSHIFSSRKTVDLVNGNAPAWLNLVNPTLAIGHQQVSVVLNSGTAVFYLDDSDASIKSALVTAFGGGSSSNWSISRYSVGVYISWSGIVVTVSSVTFSSTDVELSSRTSATPFTSNSGALDIVTTGSAEVSIRLLKITGHGASAGDRCTLWLENIIVAQTRVLVVADVDHLYVEASATAADDFRATHFTRQAAAAYRIATGTKDCTVRITQKFYLPGVTVGITTGADVPTVPTYLDALGWFAAVIAWISDATVYRAIGVGELGSWQGPILAQTTEEVQLADAIETRSVSA